MKVPMTIIIRIGLQIEEFGSKVKKSLKWESDGVFILGSFLVDLDLNAFITSSMNYSLTFSRMKQVGEVICSNDCRLIMKFRNW